MAVYYARATGNVNGTIWATTPSGTASDLFSSFTNADVLMANNFTVTLNVNTTVAEVRNDSANSATAGGSFSLSGGVTLTANVFAGVASCVAFALASPNSASIVGTITGGTSSGVTGGVFHSGTGTLTITGNVVGGSGLQANGVYINSSGTINITGQVTGGSTGGAFGVYQVSAASSVSVTGNVTGGSAGVGLLNQSPGTTTVVGIATGGSGAAGLQAQGSAVVTVTRAKGNGFGNGSTGVTAAFGVNNAASGSTINVYEVEWGDLGQSPTSGPITLLNATSNVALFYRTSGGKKTLIDSAASAGHPAASNVRSGIVYANGNQTGTCAVPAAGSVALGVAVDNTTGTAVLTQANVEAALGAFSSGRLGNCATVASVGQQLADALTTP